MEIFNNTKAILLPAILVVSSMLTINSAFANNTIDVSVGSTSHVKITNLSAKMVDNTIAVSGKMVRGQRGHMISKSGKVKVELYDDAGSLLKTVNLNLRRHRHHVNKPYKFSSNIEMASHNVSKVVFTSK